MLGPDSATGILVLPAGSPGRLKRAVELVEVTEGVLRSSRRGSSQPGQNAPFPRRDGAADLGSADQSGNS